MKLSFDDTESFKEAAGSLRFNNHPSDPNTSSIVEEGNKARTISTTGAFRRQNKPDMNEVSGCIVLRIMKAIKRTRMIETWKIDHFRTKFELPPR